MGQLKTGPQAIELIKHFESLHDGDLHKVGLQPKMDPVGIWTVGWGHALKRRDGSFIRGADKKAEAELVSTVLTEFDADQLLMQDLVSYEKTALSCLNVEVEENLTDDQFGALVSFVYNCGPGYRNHEGKYVLYQVWQNVFKEVISKSLTEQELFEYWASSVISSGGRVLPGLILRRKCEANLFITGVLSFDFTPILHH